MNGSTVVESFILPNKSIALWKKKNLLSTGSYTLGTFKIRKHE